MTLDANIHLVIPLQSKCLVVVTRRKLLEISNKMRLRVVFKLTNSQFSVGDIELF